MLSKDMMIGIDQIEAIANKIGLQNRRFQIRELTVIQVMEPNGGWALFDPIRQGKDVAKMLFAATKIRHPHMTELEFRMSIISELMKYDLTVS